MSVGGIDKSRIDAMVLQLRAAAAARMEAAEGIVKPSDKSNKLDFADALKKLS